MSALGFQNTPVAISEKAKGIAAFEGAGRCVDNEWLA